MILKHATSLINIFNMPNCIHTTMLILEHKDDIKNLKILNLHLKCQLKNPTMTIFVILAIFTLLIVLSLSLFDEFVLFFIYLCNKSNMPYCVYIQANIKQRICKYLNLHV